VARRDGVAWWGPCSQWPLQGGRGIGVAAQQDEFLQQIALFQQQVKDMEIHYHSLNRTKEIFRA